VSSFVFPPHIDIWFICGCVLLAFGVVALVRPAWIGRFNLGRRLLALRLPAVVVGAVLVVAGFLAATPETYLPNPVPSTVQSLAVGRDVYLNNCSACHGADARGGGPQAGTTPVRPPSLAGPGSHLGDHTDGDLHYTIVSGLPGGMPAWAGQLSDEEVWSVINYLRSLQIGSSSEP
jgi:mono/diheme cytochrome c family protein